EGVERRLRGVKVRIPPGCINADYEKAMARALAEARARGVHKIVFGDLFLEDVRKYREERLAGSGVEPVFPLWGRDTRRLANEMLAGGLRATVVCVDPRRPAPSLAGEARGARFLPAPPPERHPAGAHVEVH